MADRIPGFDVATAILLGGKIVAEHQGGREREYCGIVDGRPWLYPNELVLEYHGDLYVITKPMAEGPYKRCNGDPHS